MPPIRRRSAPGWTPSRAVLIRSGAALGLEALDDFAGPDSGGAAPLASAAFFRALIGERSRQARLLLRQRLVVHQSANARLEHGAASRFSAASAR